MMFFFQIRTNYDGFPYQMPSHESQASHLTMIGVSQRTTLTNDFSELSKLRD